MKRLRTLCETLKSESSPKLRFINAIQRLAKLTGVGVPQIELAPNQPGKFSSVGIEARKHHL